MAELEELQRELDKARAERDELDLELRDTRLLVKEVNGFVKYYQDLLQKLELDALTGLPGSNKYIAFKATVEKHAATVGVIAFDVNDLKYYNDNKGHQAGDHLLQMAAESFHFVADRRVQIFRTGGDEFVGIAMGCTESDIDAIIAKWQKKLEELNSAAAGIRCNIAFGCAYGDKGYKIDDVLALADERMYAEKQRMKKCGLKIGEMR
ncbi:MAG: GGDEF domain-containing protein [Chitinispirillia bacterium]|nr:GGDEF domain-containing protein [Chitinispirillia bacterium]MCL2268970.1 GGDEF domain-containing protein [Chitinispirillia bacterium]